MKKIIKIVKANISDKSKLGEWYKERLEICGGCDKNSKNTKPSTPMEIIYEGINMGAPFCLLCGCGLKAKLSIPEEECEMKPPKWNGL